MEMISLEQILIIFQVVGIIVGIITIFGGIFKIKPYLNTKTKKECKSLEIDFKDVKIDLTGRKDFYVHYGSFPLMISPARININSI